MADRVIGFLSELRTRRLLVPVVAVAAGAVTAAIVLAIQLPGSSQGASGAPKTTGSATVQRQNLVATDTQSGTLGYAQPSTVYNRLSGTITWLPKVGQQITAGGTLFKVDNSPVVLFDGPTPAYRTLTSGVSDGPDIQELNQNLVNLGFDPSHEITVNQTWQTGTTDAVNRWQSATGQTQTGSVTLGQVVFLPGSQLITTVQTLLGSTGGSSGSGSSGSGSSGSGSSGSASGASGSAASGTSQASLSGAPPAPQFVDLKTTTTTPTTTTPDSNSATMTPSGSGSVNGGSSGDGSAKSNAQLLALIALLKAEIAELKASKSSAQAGGSSRGGSAGGSASAAGGRSSGGGGGGGASAGGGSASGGSGSGAGSSAGGATAQPVLQTTSNQEVVTVNLDATKQTEAVVGEDVTVQLPNSSTVDGKITQVSPVAQSSSSSSSSSGSAGSSGAGGSGASATPSATIPVTITLTGKRPVRGLDQAAVSVNFAQQRASNVLSVPVTALIATQGGGYVVQQAASPHTLIPVTPGLFAAGYVQISGSGIYPGLQVTDSQG
ncbi:MAG TPA: peptidoglycan-binding protein [Solirubrobacteraceae bacterium]|nr:peptidoglycan-binding protein [Solirubrobacteraceae bacterium]